MNDTVNPENRRKSKRFDIKEKISITDRFSNMEVWVLANLSLEGLMIAGSYPLQQDTIYQVILKFPEPINTTTSIEIGIDCLWTHGNTDMHWSGCQIIDYSDNDKEILNSIIQAYKSD